MGTSTPSISAVLPAYNEEAVITSVVEATAAALRANGVPGSEIIVVDDGSRDATATPARARARARARAVVNIDGVPPRVASHTTNRGYGAALRTGFESAACEAVWLMDSDGQFDPADLRLLVAEYEHDRVVAGDRIRRSDTF